MQVLTKKNSYYTLFLLFAFLTRLGDIRKIQTGNSTKTGKLLYKNVSSCVSQ